MHTKPFIDARPMWFVEVLLIYLLGYADWRGWRRRHTAFPYHSGRACFAPGRTLGVLPAGTSFATVLVRLVFPWDSHQVGEFQLWQGPQYLAMFGLGIVAAQRGWLDPVPDQIRRKCGAVALIRILSFLAPHRRDPRHRPISRPRPARARAAAAQPPRRGAPTDRSSDTRVRLATPGRCDRHWLMQSSGRATPRDWIRVAKA